MLLMIIAWQWCYQSCLVLALVHDPFDVDFAFAPFFWLHNLLFCSCFLHLPSLPLLVLYARCLSPSVPPGHWSQQFLLLQTPLMFTEQMQQDVIMVLKFPSNSPVTHVAANTQPGLASPAIITVTANRLFSVNKWHGLTGEHRSTWKGKKYCATSPYQKIEHKTLHLLPVFRYHERSKLINLKVLFSTIG